MVTGLLSVHQIPQRDPWLHEGCGAGPPEEISERGASFPARQETPLPTGVGHRLWAGQREEGGATSSGQNKGGAISSGRGKGGGATSAGQGEGEVSWPHPSGSHPSQPTMTSV